MIHPSRLGRRTAGRVFLLAALVLLGGSLLSPGTVEDWAETRRQGWQRTLARIWSEAVSETSEALRLNEGRRLVSEVLDRGPGPASTLPPATRPQETSISDAQTLTFAPVETTVDMAESVTTVPVTTVPVTTVPVTTVPVTTVPVTTVPVTTVPVTTVPVTTVPVTTVPALETGDASTMPTGISAVRMATAEAPLRILGVGDSLMLDLQYGLERVLAPRPDITVEGRGALGFGFLVPFWDWEEDVLPDYAGMVATIRPDVVVAMIGANEFQGYAIEGEDLVPGSERWRQVLAERADEAIAHWLAGGARLYWWTTPTMANPEYRTKDLNEVWAEAVDAWRPWATTLESMAVLGGANGEFRWDLTDEDGTIVALRKEHGVHFYEIGADLLASQLEERLVVDGWLAVAN